MPLIGKRLSHYRILHRIGAGGMGHVYAANDDRTSRLVAIKVLPDGLLAADDERRRFRREILALSEVHHPHIAAIYDFDTQGDIVFLVMEYVRGETLADRLRRGPMALLTAYETASQIADALCAAHERGVMHRDLKPSNIVLVPDGGVKLVDFGLAKRIRTGEQGPEPDSETRTAGRVSTQGSRPITQAGHGVGTPGYMSPEQIAGTSQDARTDVFSFGCVLYECLTGEAAFPGGSVDARLAESLARQPDWSLLPDDLRPEILDLLRGSLAKSPDSRPRNLETFRAALRAGQAAGAGPRPTSKPNNFPDFATPFIGRVREIEQCRELLRANRLVTVTGPGGSGKTRLALRVAEASLEDFPGGACYLDFARVGDPARVVGFVTATFGLSQEGGEDHYGRLAQHLSREPIVLLADNCEEHSAEIGGLVDELLARCPAVKVLATSRQPLRLRGERSFPLASFSVPRPTGPQTAESIAPYESVAFFLSRAGLVAPEFRLTDANAPVLAGICRALDGIPLALELAAARLRILSLDELGARLSERFRILSTPDPGLDPRHATLRSVIQWSYDHLMVAEQEALRALATFSGGCLFEGVEAVRKGGPDSMELLDPLARLADMSLLDVRRSSQGKARYVLLETVRAYARDMSERLGETADLRGRHLEYCLALVADAETGLKGADQADWLARLEEEHEDILAALEWCRESRKGAEPALGIVNSIWRFWYLRGYLSTGCRALEKTLALDDARRPTPARAKALRTLGMLMDLSGEYAASRPIFEESLAICEQLGDEQGLAFTRNGLAGVALNLGDYGAARSLYRAVAAYLRQRGDTASLGIALGNLGLCARYLRDLNAAERYFRESVRVSSEGGDQGGRAINIAVLAATRMGMGKLRAARRDLMEALGVASRIGERRALAFALKWTGDLALSTKDAEAAGRFLGFAEAVRISLGAVLWTDDETEMRRIQQAARSLGDDRFKDFVRRAAEISDQGKADVAMDWLRTPPGKSRRRSLESAKGTRGTQSTAKILALARAGDARARDQLCKRFIPILRRWAHGRLPNAARDLVDTDDMVQVTLVRAMARLNDFSARGEGAFLAYLRRILVNRLRDEARRARRSPVHEEMVEALAAVMPSPLDDLVRRNSLAAYERELDLLPKRTREAILLRTEMQYGYARIASALGVRNAGAARMIVSRGLDRLARRLSGVPKRARPKLPDGQGAR